MRPLTSLGESLREIKAKDMAKQSRLEDYRVTSIMQSHITP